jgi:hypothetical protein
MFGTRADRIITQAIIEGTSRNSSGDSIRRRDVFEGDYLVRIKDVTAILLWDLLDVTGSKFKRQSPTKTFRMKLESRSYSRNLLVEGTRLDFCEAPSPACDWRASMSGTAPRILVSFRYFSFTYRLLPGFCSHSRSRSGPPFPLPSGATEPGRPKDTMDVERARRLSLCRSLIQPYQSVARFPLSIRDLVMANLSSSGVSIENLAPVPVILEPCPANPVIQILATTSRKGADRSHNYRLQNR